MFIICCIYYGDGICPGYIPPIPMPGGIPPPKPPIPPGPPNPPPANGFCYAPAPPRPIPAPAAPAPALFAVFEAPESLAEVVAVFGAPPAALPLTK